MHIIKELREEHGLTQQQLAERMGVTQAAVARWESGENKLNSENLIKLADILNTTTDALLGRDTA